MCEIGAAKHLNTLLSTLDETTYLRILEAQAECRSNNGAIARSFPEEKQHDNVLHNQHYTGNSSVLIWFCTNVQNGAVPFSPHQQRKAKYTQICQTTGFGGQPIKAPGHGGAVSADPSVRLQPVTSAKRIRITFNGSVSDVLPWKFVPQQREVRVLPGETALAFYTATNMSDQDIIGVATYSVTPGQVAPYFSKIQCFCFEEQRLNAGETVDMPVFFYIDPDFVNDPNMRGIEQVTLSYTFFSE